MNVNAINSVAFSGTVNMDKLRVSRQIYKLYNDYSIDKKTSIKQADAIITGISDLKKRIENETPKDRSYSLDFFVGEAPVPNSKGARYPKDYCVIVMDNQTGKNYENIGSLTANSSDKMDASAVKFFYQPEDGANIKEKAFDKLAEKIIADSNKAPQNASKCTGEIGEILNRLG